MAAQLCAAALVGLGIGRIAPLNLPTFAWISLIAIILTIPAVPGSATVLSLVEKVNFLALATPILPMQAFSLSSQEFSLVRQAGWKIVIVAIYVMVGTFMGSTLIADMTLGILG